MAVEVKICGIRTMEALAAALAAGADYVGLVHFARSPRHLAIEAMAPLAAAARGRAKVVVLLVDPDDALVDQVAREIAPDLLQLHGHESVARLSEIRSRAGVKQVMKAVSVATSEDVAAALAYLAPGRLADVILFDAKAPPDARHPGGNGLAFDWHILDRLKGRQRYALAGGLTPANVAAAIRLAGPAIVDVSSGVERAPGEKDADLIRALITAARSA
jgi:phosphoribosylanthranilate isomerase